jgi:hypothetical protein
MEAALTRILNLVMQLEEMQRQFRFRARIGEQYRGAHRNGFMEGSPKLQRL